MQVEFKYYFSLLANYSDNLHFPEELNLRMKITRAELHTRAGYFRPAIELSTTYKTK